MEKHRYATEDALDLEMYSHGIPCDSDQINECLKFAENAIDIYCEKHLPLAPTELTENWTLDIGCRQYFKILNKEIPQDVSNKYEDTLDILRKVKSGNLVIPSTK